MHCKSLWINGSAECINVNAKLIPGVHIVWIDQVNEGLSNVGQATYKIAYLSRKDSGRDIQVVKPYKCGLCGSWIAMVQAGALSGPLVR